MKAAKSLFGILAVTLALTTHTPAQTFLTNGLVGWYPFNGNANDASGNGNDAIISGALLTSDRFGLPSSAYSFAPPDEIVTTNVTGFPSSTNDFTVSFWANVSSNYGSAQSFMYDKSFWGFGIRIAGIQNSLTQIEFRAGGAKVGYTPFISWKLQQWYNVQVVRSQNTNILIYRDGVQLSQQTTVAAAFLQSLVFGNYSNAEGYGELYGGLDDVRIYDRALSPSELQQLYQYESGPRVGVIKAVKPVFDNLSLGTNYQLQLSADLNTWTNEGSPFIATNTIMIYPQYWEVDNWNDLFFRLQISP